MKKKCLKSIGRSLLLAMCVMIPAVSGSAETQLGTPKKETLLQMAQECLERYNFCGLFMNPEEWQAKAAAKAAAEAGSRSEADAQPDAASGTGAAPELSVEDLRALFGEGTTSGGETMSGEEMASGSETEALFVPEQYIMVGDSRFVGMEMAVGNAGCTWICAESTGLAWFTETAAPQIDQAVTDRTAIIINLGVNDLGNVMGYLDALRQKVPEWMDKGAVVYYMSVNPVENHATITNEDIAEFNNVLYNNMPQEMGWIETNKYLQSSGYGTLDGVHFDSMTYQTIFNYSMEVIAGFSGGGTGVSDGAGAAGVSDGAGSSVYQAPESPSI